MVDNRFGCGEVREHRNCRRWRLGLPDLAPAAGYSFVDGEGAHS